MQALNRRVSGSSCGAGVTLANQIIHNKVVPVGLPFPVGVTP
jgi:hypothetical protein